MPIEIHELQITTVVQDTPSSLSNTNTSSTINTDTIVAICVEQVLEILQQKIER